MRSAGGTAEQVALQRSPGVPLLGPSSHCSPHSRIPLPHTSRWHVAEQPSQAVVLPSSHCSPSSTLPLPHTAGLGVHTSFTRLPCIRRPAVSSAATERTRRPTEPDACGTRIASPGVQSL